MKIKYDNLLGKLREEDQTTQSSELNMSPLTTEELDSLLV